MTEIVHVGPAPISDRAREERVRMRDGVMLATDVYLPGAASHPDDTPGDTVLIRLPYDKSGDYTFIPLIAEYFTAHGYRVVAQDVRGKFRSDGETLLFVNEARDGYDTIEWITQQRWSNGRVAMWGDSYYGFTQWAAVSTQHPALKAISPRVTGTMLGEPVHRDARTRPVEMAITYLYPTTYFHSRDGYFWDLDADRRPYSGQIEDVFAQLGERSISYDQWHPHPVFLDRFPDGAPLDARPVPVLHTIGWWDNCAPLSWADETQITARPAWDINRYLRIESMDHEAYYLDDDPVEDRPEEQVRAELPRMLDPTVAFFEVFVRGNGGPADIPKVAWNLAGTSGMRESAQWPPAGTERRVLYATADGGLADAAPSARTAREWVHDPADPVPSSAPNAFAFLFSRPDEAPLGDRDDVLVFTAAPVTADTDLVGPVTATARVRCDGPVLALFLRLLDVAPDGRALRIARGQVEIADAEQPVSVEVDLGHLGYRLRVGHRLRVHVSASDSPEFIAQPGTGDDPWSATETRPNTACIELGGEDAFRLTVTELPAAHLPATGGTR